MGRVDSAWKYTNPFYVIPMIPVGVGILAAVVVRRVWKFVGGTANDFVYCVSDE
jgi:hypothetical protein